VGTMKKDFKIFSEFYPFYLNEHRNLICRRLHFVGSSLVLLVIVYSMYTTRWSLLWLTPIMGYGFAWTGHYFFEKNRPATFIYPFYSFIGDWVMFKDILTGKIRF